MSDNEEKKDNGSASKEPLRHRRVEVEVKPRRKQDLDDYGVARKAERRIKEKVEKSVDAAESDGSEAQFDAADRALDEEKVLVPSKHVSKIRVKVDGNRKDERGKTEHVSHERDVEAGE